MAYTKHGQLIPGTVADAVEPTYVARCGGVKMCHECQSEAAAYLGSTQPFIEGQYKTTYPSPDEIVDFPSLARKIVVRYVIRHQKIDEEPLVEEKDVFVVWYAKTLQHWKALVSTNLSDGMYYELTYNGDKKEVYLDAYKKIDNVRLPV